MSGAAVGFVGIAALFALLALRIPVAFAMFVVGFFGIIAPLSAVHGPNSPQAVNDFRMSLEVASLKRKSGALATGSP